MANAVSESKEGQKKTRLREPTSIDKMTSKYDGDDSGEMTAADDSYKRQW
jgi:hypothetical protein